MKRRLRLPKSTALKRFTTNIEELFKDENVDIIYIYHTAQHAYKNILRKALAAGKHVLCEKVDNAQFR